MRKVLLIIFGILLLIVSGELSYYFYLLKTLKSQPLQSQPTSVSASSFQPLSPQTLQTVKGETLISVYAKIEKISPDNQLIVISDKEGRSYNVRIGGKTIFLTRSIIKNIKGENIPTEELESQPFPLKVGEVYQFEWLNQREEPWELIRITRSSKK